MICLNFLKKWDTKADCIRHPCARYSNGAINNPYVCNTGSWEFGWTLLSLALGSTFEHIHPVHQGCVFQRREWISSFLLLQRHKFPFSIKFLKSACLEKAGLDPKSQAWYSRKHWTVLVGCLGQLVSYLFEPQFVTCKWKIWREKKNGLDCIVIKIPFILWFSLRFCDFHQSSYVEPLSIQQIEQIFEECLLSYVLRRL